MLKIEYVLVISNNIILLIWVHIANVGFVDISMKMICIEKECKCCSNFHLRSGSKINNNQHNQKL